MMADVPVDILTSHGWRSLNGPQGDPGPTGPTGPKGDTGEQGPAGSAGSVIGAMTWKGDWASGSTYAKDDVVLYKSTAWHAPVAMPAGIIPGTVVSAPVVNLTNADATPAGKTYPHIWLGTVDKFWAGSISDFADYRWFYFDVVTAGTLTIDVSGGANSTAIYRPDGTRLGSFFTGDNTVSVTSGRWKIGIGTGGGSVSGTVKLVPGTAVLGAEPIPAERWEALASGMTWKGAYNSTATYALNDVVLSNGDLYIAPAGIPAGITPGGADPNLTLFTIPGIPEKTFSRIDKSQPWPWTSGPNSAGHTTWTYFFFDVIAPGPVYFTNGIGAQANVTLYKSDGSSPGGGLVPFGGPAQIPDLTVGRWYVAVKSYPSGTLSGNLRIDTSGLDVTPRSQPWTLVIKGSVTVQTDYTVTPGYTKDRAFDPETASVQEVARVLGSLVDDLKTSGLIKP